MMMVEGTELSGPISSFAARAHGQVEIYEETDKRGYLALGPDDEASMAIYGAHKIKIRIAQGRFGFEAGPYLFRVGIWAPADYRDEFLRWYETEHFPILLECPLWHGGRLVEEQIDNGCQFYALHNLENPAALDSEARKRSRATEWFARLARHSWFDKGFIRTLYRRVSH